MVLHWNDTFLFQILPAGGSQKVCYAGMEWHLPLPDFTVAWLTQGLLSWNGPSFYPKLGVLCWNGTLLV